MNKPSKLYMRIIVGEHAIYEQNLHKFKFLNNLWQSIILNGEFIFLIIGKFL